MKEGSCNKKKPLMSSSKGIKLLVTNLFYFTKEISKETV